jgi:hypothetical protein
MVGDIGCRPGNSRNADTQMITITGNAQSMINSPSVRLIELPYFCTEDTKRLPAAEPVADRQPAR